MKIQRKIVRPMMAFFAFFLVLFTVLLLRDRYDMRQRVIYRESATLIHDLRVHQEFLQRSVMAVAVDWAYNQDFAQALAERDRQRLYTLGEPLYQRFRRELDVAQIQFHTPPATSFLRLHAPERYGDDLSDIRPMVVDANRSLQALSGLEVGRAGLGMRAVVPVIYQRRHVGSVEVGIEVRQGFLSTLKEADDAEWTLWLLPKYAAEVELIPEVKAAAQNGQLVLWASTLERPLHLDEEIYRRIMDGEARVITKREMENGHQFVIFTIPLYDYSRHLIGFVDAAYDETDLIQEQQQYFALYLFLLFLSVLILGSVVFWTLETSLSPLHVLEQAVRDFAAGNLDQPLTVTSDDEVGDLARGIEEMRQRLRDLLQRMGARIAERTEELRRRSHLLLAVSHLSRVAASIHDPGELLETMAQRMTEELGFYHVGIFLRDVRGEYMVLRAASSEGGKRMLAAGHRLRIGETGIVGYVAHTGQPRIAQATETDTAFFDNPYLPQTQAEMALPLRIGKEIIGVLDVQATETEAFEETEISIFQALADQLALSLHNARLLREADMRLKEVNRLLIESSVAHWREKLAESWFSRYFYDGIQVQPLAEEGALPRMDGEGEAAMVMDFPLEPRSGELLGTLRLAWDSAPSPAEIEIVRQVAGKIAGALESARLFIESQDLLVEAELLHRLQGEISAAQSPQEITRIFAEQLLGGEIDRVILLQDMGERKGMFIAFWGSEEDPLRQRIGYEIVLPMALVQSYEPIFFDDLEASGVSEEDIEIFRAARVRSIAIVPLISAGERWGWLVMEAVERVYRFHGREKRLLRLLSRGTAVALQNILLVEFAQHRALREQQARELADAMQRTADMELMLQQVVEGLREALGASYVALRLGEKVDEAGALTPKSEEEA